MGTVLVPVRYPLSQTSRHTLEQAIGIAEEREAEVIVLHVDLFQNGDHVTRTDLKREVEQVVGRVPRARYVVRRGFLVEEGILEELADSVADVAVIGQKQLGRWRRALNRMRSDPDIAEYLQDRIECEIVVVTPPA